MNNKDYILVGFDIHKFVSDLCNQFLGLGVPDMTEGEEKAYRLGVNNVLGLLNQTVNEFIKDEDTDKDATCMAVHVPNLEIMTEFRSVDEVLNKMKEMNK